MFTPQFRNFFYVTLADFIARAAYQMGKTPLLPIFAATLGATDALLGFIISVSTLTGMILKPLIGVLSDRWGRRWWLIIGTAFFAIVPFFYLWVHTPEQLIMIRVIHGLATAIYGPVTVAYIAEQTQQQRAERLGWFGLARSGGYIVGPALAGMLLISLQPVMVFPIIGLMSLLAFVPIFLVGERPNGEQAAISPRNTVSLFTQIRQALHAGSTESTIWLAGGLEATAYIALYAIKAFLPIYALTAGVDLVAVGFFFSVQETALILLKPAGGRLGDRLGYWQTIAGGMLIMAIALPLLALTHSLWSLFAISILLGMGQALVFPATIALAATQIDERHMGAAIGLIGTLQNGGKVIGPLLGGVLIRWLGYEMMFWSFGWLLALSAALILKNNLRFGDLRFLIYDLRALQWREWIYDFRFTIYERFSGATGFRKSGIKNRNSP